MFAVLMTSFSSFAMIAGTPIPNYWLNPVASAAPLNQYHAQDGSGSYRYGYTGPHHAKMEMRANGVTQGGYSYIDANGIVQSVSYLADAENGFRVRASNLPQQPENINLISETSEAAAARRRHLDQFAKIAGNNNALDANRYSDLNEHRDFPRDTTSALGVENSSAKDLRNPFLLNDAEAARIEIPKPDPRLLEIMVNKRSDDVQRNKEIRANYESFKTPTRIVALPEIQRNLVAQTSPTSSYVLPVVPYRLLHSSLHHSQDSLGQYDYSYVGDTSSKTESRSLDGTTRGAYSYVDANGLLQQVHYIADHNGFRVLATNLPEA